MSLPVLFQVLVTSLRQTSAPSLPTPCTFFHIGFEDFLLQACCPKRQFGALALEWERRSLEPSSAVCDLEQVL